MADTRAPLLDTPRVTGLGLPLAQAIAELISLNYGRLAPVSRSNSPS